jgi:hypothetical protein
MRSMRRTKEDERGREKLERDTPSLSRVVITAKRRFGLLDRILDG